LVKTNRSKRVADLAIPPEGTRVDRAIPFAEGDSVAAEVPPHDKQWLSMPLRSSIGTLVDHELHSV
jgi:hypothetical protein